MYFMVLTTYFQYNIRWYRSITKNYEGYYCIPDVTRSATSSTKRMMLFFGSTRIYSLSMVCL